MLAVFHAVLIRDLRRAWRSGSALALGPIFFFLVLTLFPLALAPDPALLARLAPGLLTVCAVLAVLLALDRLFDDDQANGTLSLFMLSAYPLPLLVAGKLAAHWVLYCVPLLLMAPALSLMLNASTVLGMIMLSLTLLTLYATALGGITAALALTSRRGKTMLALMLLPLLIPAIIFAVSTVDLAAMGLDPYAPLLFLAAMNAAAIPLAPFLASAILRAQLQ